MGRLGYYSKLSFQAPKEVIPQKSFVLRSLLIAFINSLHVMKLTKKCRNTSSHPRQFRNIKSYAFKLQIVCYYPTSWQLIFILFYSFPKEHCVTPCDNETVADVDDFPVVDLECSQPLLNGASAFVGENSEKLVCIPEATSIDTEDVTDLSCSHDGICVKTCQPTGICKKGTQRPLASSVPYKELCERRKLECRTEVIDTMNKAALKFVCYEKKDVPDFGWCFIYRI